MSRNSCGNEGPWALFTDHLNGISSTTESSSLEANSCVCDGPNQTEFLGRFREFFAGDNYHSGPSSDNYVTIRNVTQIPLLVDPDGKYNMELCPVEEAVTTFSYDGVCPGNSERRK